MIASRLGMRLNGLRNVKTLRTMSTSASLVTVEKTEVKGVVTMKLNAPPVNSLNLEMLSAIDATLKSLEVRCVSYTPSTPDEVDLVHDLKLIQKASFRFYRKMDQCRVWY